MNKFKIGSFLISIGVFFFILLGVRYFRDIRRERNVCTFGVILCDENKKILTIDLNDDSTLLEKKISNFIQTFSEHLSDLKICPMFTPCPEFKYIDAKINVKLDGGSVLPNVEIETEEKGVEIVGGFYGVRKNSTGEVELLKQDEFYKWQIIIKNADFNHIAEIIARKFIEDGKSDLKLSEKLLENQ